MTAKKSARAPTVASKLPDLPRPDATLAEWAIYNGEVGRITGAWKVFPCVPGEKRPLNKGWQDEAAWDRKTIETMWQNDPASNIGLAIQPGFVAIDGDLYKPGAQAELDRFEVEHGRLPDTLEHKTPSGGYHLFFATAKTVGNGRGTLPKFGDVRGHGGLVVGPGSIFNGKRYTVDNLVLPVALPKHIEGMLSESKTRDRSKPDALAPCVLLDDPGNVKAFTDWCAGKSVRTIATPNGEVAEPSVENDGGNNTLAATGAMAHDYGLSPDMALSIAIEHHNPRCMPPWDDDQYETHFLSGYKSASGQLGCRAPSQDHSSAFKPVPKASPVSKESEHEFKAGRFRLVTREGIEEISPPEWLVRDLLPEGAYTILFGAPGTFKTFVAMDIGARIAAGISESSPWGAVEKPGAVLFAVGEGRANHRKRITAWEQTHNGGKRIQNFVLIDPVPLVTEDWTPFIELAKRASPAGYRLIVIDTIGRAMQGADENAQKDASKFTKLVETLQRELGACVLAIHHSGHGNSERSKGSVEFVGAPDTVVGVTRNAKDYVVSLSMSKQKDAPEWEQARYVKLSEVSTPIGDSLVVVKPTEGEIPKAPARDNTEILRDIHAQFILAALRSVRGRQWKTSELAGEARKRGCQINFDTLRTDVLGVKKGKPGWARTHRVLSQYFRPQDEKWVTPHTLPQMDPAFELKDDECQ
jgi:hypothetical protein